MKKLVLVLLILLSAAFYYFFYRSSSSLPLPLSSPVAVSPQPEMATGPERKSLFVPYWSLSAADTFDDYDTLIYFGVTPGESGVNTDDVGYTTLTKFSERAAGKRSYLTLRMLDSKQNFEILANPSLQSALIEDTLLIAKRYDFDGVVLDLEVSALPFASVIDQISSFNKQFYQATKQQKLHYSVAIYGDTFFRIRPFDVTAIGKNSDEVMIMAYDFHKARGNPGPNFPLGGKDRYGYDYERLISQFSEAVPKEKLTVVFGLFGYDWMVDKEKNMVTHGSSLSWYQIDDRFLSNCQFDSCVVSRDPLSAESFVSYTDDAGKSHIVWYEDLESVAKKQKFLQTKGVASFSYWAYSYF